MVFRQSLTANRQNMLINNEKGITASKKKTETVSFISFEREIPFWCGFLFIPNEIFRFSAAGWTANRHIPKLKFIYIICSVHVEANIIGFMYDRIFKWLPIYGIPLFTFCASRSLLMTEQIPISHSSTTSNEWTTCDAYSSIMTEECGKMSFRER